MIICTGCGWAGPEEKEFMFEATGDIPKEHADKAIVGIGQFATKIADEKLAVGNMVRSPAAGKLNAALVFRGPMLIRWAELLTRGAVNYGADNWLEGLREPDLALRAKIKQRYKDSVTRHFFQWMRGDRDEDHAAAMYFNLNGYEAMLDTDDPVTRPEKLKALDLIIGG